MQNAGSAGMTFTPDKSCVLLIDFQSRLMPVIGEAKAIVDNARRLAQAALLLDIPVLATEQNRSGLGETISELRELPRATFSKRSFDATKDGKWAGFIPRDRSVIVLAGCEAHVCVLQTAIGLLGMGHTVLIACDAVGSRTPLNRDAGLYRAERFGAELATTEMVLFEWLGDCDHAAFRDVLKLVK